MSGRPVFFGLREKVFLQASVSDLDVRPHPRLLLFLAAPRALLLFRLHADRERTIKSLSLEEKSVNTRRGASESMRQKQFEQDD